MTLDQSLANLQRQADRLAGHFSAIADRIENGGHPYVGADPVAAYAKGVSDAMKPQVATGPVEVMARGDHWDHTHEGAELVYHGEGQAVELPTPINPTTAPPEGYHFTGSSPTALAPNTPQGAAPSSTQTTAIPTAGAVEVEGPGVGAPETPRPAAPNPFETAPAAAAPPTEKKKGRRTHEELAADNGVSLADVKAWLGDKKVTKAAIEEYASLARANAVGETPVQAAITTPPDGSHLPQAVSDPFGQVPAPQQPAAPGFDVPPSTGAGAHVAATQMDYSQQPAAPAQQWPTGPDGQPLPVSQPVAQAQAAAGVPPTPDNPFGQTPENPWAGEQPVTDWSPFQ